MKKIAFCLENCINNNCFDLSNLEINRDNCSYSLFLLKKIFKKYNFNLSTCDINSIDESEYIIYSEIPKKLPRKEDIKISYLLLLESKLIRPDNWDLNKHKNFNKIFTWNDKFVNNKKYYKVNFSHKFPNAIKKYSSKKNKLCTLIAGNKRVGRNSSELYSKRVEAIRWFEKNHLDDFDLYGVGWDECALTNKYFGYLFKKLKLSKIFKPNFVSYKGAVDSKVEVLEKYKFSICYENAKNIDGYITEKIFDCFFAGCIPIYWGANNITEHIPKECFIDKRDFASYEGLYEYITNISVETYQEYLNNIEIYLNGEKVNEFKAEFFANTIVNTILNDIR